MGYNTPVWVLNDALYILRENPEQFVEGIFSHRYQEGSFQVGNHVNPVYMLPTLHADVTQLIIGGGNFMTRAFTSPSYRLRNHHTREGQVEMLRAWADSLGFDLLQRKKRVDDDGVLRVRVTSKVDEPHQGEACE